MTLLKTYAYKNQNSAAPNVNSSFEKVDKIAILCHFEEPKLEALRILNFPKWSNSNSGQVQKGKS